jgi:hypothetical protein
LRRGRFAAADDRKILASLDKYRLAPDVLNAFVLKNLRTIEMIGVLMRIFSFSLVSWLGPASPFLFVWSFNTIDALMLSWCAVLKKDTAYSVLNLFWIMVGIVGILRAANLIR